MDDTNTARPPDWVPDVDQHLERLTALCRLVTGAVASRHDFGGNMQPHISDVQVSIALLCHLHKQIQCTEGYSRLYDLGDAGDWLHFGGLLGILDAEAWRLVDVAAGEEGIAESDLANLEHGLRHLAETAERVLAFLKADDAAKEAQHA